MEYPMATFLTIILLTIAADPACGKSIIASRNPLPVGSDVTLSLSNQTTIIVGTWLFESIPILIMYDGGSFIFPPWQERITFNRTSAELSIKSLQMSDSGIYKLTGGEPSFEVEIALSVQELISNVTLSANAAHLVEFNDSAVFNCSVSNGSSLSYVWTNNGSVVPQDADGVLFSGGGAVLTIANVTRYDRGPFMCTVFNGVSRESSALILLHISYGPSNPKMVPRPMMVAYKTGSNLTLSCHAESSPPATVHWFFNDMDLSLSGPEIHLIHTKENQTGYYMCLLYNPVTCRYNSVKTMVRILDPIYHVSVSRTGGPVILGQSVTLSCDVNGSVDSISWWKNGTAMMTHNMTSLRNRSLTLDSVTKQDAVDYNCQAFNFVSNMTSSPYRLIVNYGPEAVAIRGPSVGLAGDQVTFDCSSSSEPPSQYSWYFNGSLVANASQYITKNLTTAMSGKYICMAFNNITGCNSTAYTMLTVYDPITDVKIKGNSTSAMEGLAFTLTCDATGVVEDVHWMKDGEALNTTTMYNHMLNFKPVQKRDNGNYQCSAINAVSNMTSPEYRLHVIFGPNTPIITGPGVAETGDNVVFKCMASSYPPSYYHWYYRGDLVGNDSILETGPLSLNMSGAYTCLALNNVTGKNSTSFTKLRVLERIEHVAIKEDSLPVQSHNFTLSCAVAGFYDSISWTKDGVPLDGTNSSNRKSHMSMMNNSLHFSPVTTYDNGFYRCVAENVVRKHSSPEHQLLVNFGPYNPNITGPGVAETGDNVVFKCMASSYPPSYYHWYYRGDLVGNDSILETGPLSLNMSGAYTCLALNNVTGKNSTSFTKLRVIERIEHVAIKEDSLPVQSHNFTLSCAVAGFYDSISWTKDGVPLDGTNSSNRKSHMSMMNNSLHFSPVTTYDNGFYRCVAENVVRKHSSPEHQLLVNFGPYNPNITGPGVAETGDNVVFKCMASSYPPSYYHWYYRGDLVGNDSILETGPLSLNMSGAYTCLALNNVTGKNSTSFTKLWVLERIEHVAIKEDSLPVQSHNFTLSCAVAGFYDSISWTKDGVPLDGTNSSNRKSHMSMMNNSLHFSPVTTYDNGFYRCVAENVFRKHSSPEHQLLVNYGPWNVSISGPDVMNLGSDIKVLTCSADSRPTSQYQWFIDSVPAAEGSGPVLPVSVITPKVINYKCKAYNNVTEISMFQNKTLTINDAPGHSLASPGVLLFMILAALSVPVLGN
ncbi:carcinoembryonic antigen-related cell adhesion molecule 1 isoform X1 [Gadus chalcogrammus]|uniref:carcinoembryonic antigen-related cell adhesion molecule 1 isoform X1 n=1 Tax=Gadus chalcogrammus TaxID=1042646 RepID=UPI0024C4B995|nr:carcinoembryonic antigen-related cell adhesion molecule 1 isoform X1 [Gadus chalcogrammus]